MIQLIVARYKEDISWIQNINPNISTVIYNKYYHNEGNCLPNVGREGHTYLYHIINNYDSLCECNIFIQGNPLFHDNNIINKINTLDYKASPLFFGQEHIETIHSFACPSHIHGLPMYYFFDLLFGIKCNKNTRLKFYPGAQFVVHKNTIHSRPKEFYQFLIKFLSFKIDPIEGYVIERLWPYIFDKSLPLSSKYELFI